MPARSAAVRTPRTVPVGQLRRTLEAVRVLRANFVFGALMLLLVALLGRFAQLQLVQGAEYREQARARQRAQLVVSGVRGRIVDAHGRLLATSSFGREVAVDPDPRVLTDATLDAFCARLAALLDDQASPGDLRDRLLRARAAQVEQDGPFGLRWVRTGSRHVVLRPYVDEPRVVAALDAASSGPERLRGLKVRCVERRAYPNGSYAAHVIGLPPQADAGGPSGEGLEALLDGRLEGGQARATVTRDGKARWLAADALFDRALLAGEEVRVSLDLVVQHHLEVALDDLCRVWQPGFVVGLVLDPRTGEVLALANRPTFDPNPEARRGGLPANLAVTQLFEPGSVIKPFTVAWALARGFPADAEVPMPRSRLFPGDIKEIRDAHEIGDGDLVKLLGQSSNTGAAHLSDWMGAGSMQELLGWLALGERTGVELPGETRWKRAGRPLARCDQLRAAYGYTVRVTPMRLAAAYTALARADGCAVRPTLIPRRSGSRDGDADLLAPPLARPADLEVVRRGLLACTLTGTARDAFAGSPWRTAGKTGTAIIDALTRHVCSFVGYAPAEDPRLLVLVMAVTQRAREGSGGKVAAPAARQVIDRVLPYLGLEAASVPAAAPGAGPALAAGEGA